MPALTVDQHTDPATLVGRTIRAEGVTGRVVLFVHVTIDAATGKSRTGFAPGAVVEMRVSGRLLDETRFVYLPYGATIDLLAS